jgi:hypothetical protein
MKVVTLLAEAKCDGGYYQVWRTADRRYATTWGLRLEPGDELPVDDPTAVYHRLVHLVDALAMFSGRLDELAAGGGTVESTDFRARPRRRPKPVAPNLHETYGGDAVRILQDMMGDAADRRDLPGRFLVKYTEPANRRLILDTRTGRTAVVPLYAYGAVRQALDDLFGGDGSEA